MVNINKSLPNIKKILRDSNYRTKIYVSFASKAYGDDYDPFEGNSTDTILNHKTIYGIVSDITPESLAWKQYGQKAQGAKEILCESKYINYFEQSIKIKIGTKYYTTFRDAASSRCLITERAMGMIRVIVQQKDEA